MLKGILSVKWEYYMEKYKILYFGSGKHHHSYLARMNDHRPNDFFIDLYMMSQVLTDPLDESKG